MLNNLKQQHIPDGEWKGFYIYKTAGVKHKMNCFFTFKNGKINGHGDDDIGNYTWRGNYDKDLKVTMTKIYSTHSVFYTGYADENGMWGKWKTMNISGGFHLWPITQNTNGFIDEAENKLIEEFSGALVLLKK